MIRIGFTSNWNGKLNKDVKYFSTIRKHNPAYMEGSPVSLFLKNELIGYAEIKMLVTLPFGDIYPNVIMTDTGYGYDESRKIFCNFMQCSDADLNNIEVDYILIERRKNGHP